MIPSRFPTIDPFGRIAGSEVDFAAIESLTNPRLREKMRLTAGLAPVDQSDPRLANWNHAPFAYPSPEGSRFFGPDRTVLELFDDLQTAVAVSVDRRGSFLARTAEPATTLEMRQLIRPVRGRFADVRGMTGSDDRERRRAVGRDVVALACDGILFSPPERPSATAVVVLAAATLGRPEQGDHYKFMWDGGRIALVYSFTFDRSFTPEVLGGADDVLSPLFADTRKRLRLMTG
ncbi:RES family NAD+ phosphorylase [Sphingomonas sp. UYP23]